MNEVTLYIREMCCEEETRLLKAEVEGLAGIESYEVNLMTQSLKVTYDPSVVSLQVIQDAIARTGMESSLKKEEKVIWGRAWWKEPRILTLSVSGTFIAVTLILEHLLGLPHETARFLYGIAILIGGYYPAKMGIAALQTLVPNIRTLMVAGALGAVGLGLWEEAALLVLIYSLGDVLEAYAADRVRGAVRTLMVLAPKEALVKREGREVMVPLEDVRTGDIFIIKPGERIPLDGEIVQGVTSIDQAPITGESIPVDKGPGDVVFAGSINQRGAIEARATKPFNDTTLGRIIHYIEEAEHRKSSYQRFGETFGRYYTPFMFILAMLVILLPTILVGGFTEWFYRGLVVLVVSCSCGIALSIPVAVVAAIANAARHGVLIKGGAYIEAASRIRAIAFDKTGSLTAGRPVVTDILSFGEEEEGYLLGLAASMERRSEHVLAEAVLERAKEECAPLQEVEGFEAIPGMGAKARINGNHYCIGNKALCQVMGVPTHAAEERIRGLEEEGKTVLLLTREGVLIGVIAIRDEIRPEAKESLRRLGDFGIKGLVMLTGDNEKVARAMAEKAGIRDYQAQLLPEEKVRAIEDLKGRYGKVAMVGDGVNDAPAMVVSDLGVAMGAAGTDVAIETGDIVLMSDDLGKIPYVLGLSKRTADIIRQNIGVSLSIIAFLVPVALTGRIGLVPGLLINEVGGLLVILNSLRLLR